VIGLWFAHYACLEGTSIGGERSILINGACGGDGVCHANWRHASRGR